MLTNIKSFLEDMERKYYLIDTYLFTYNNVNTVVLVERNECFNVHSKWTIGRLTFFDIDEADRILRTEVSERSFECSVTEIRKYFKISYVESIKGFLENFYAYFNAYTPPKTKEVKTINEEQTLKKHYVSQGENPFTNCYGIIHNANKGQRRPCNTDKARRYAPEIYNYFKNDTNISFCFHKEEPSTLVEILKRSAKEDTNL